MTGHTSRVRTMQALVASLGVLASGQSVGTVQTELGEISRTRRVRAGARRRLLQVIHASRALDTLLKEFVRYHGCNPRKGTPNSLGSYLVALEEHSVTGLGNLHRNQRKRFQRVIVDPRNKYTHEAGATPATDAELAMFLSEIDACLAAVAAL